MKRIISTLLILFFVAFAANAQTELVSTGSGSAYDISYPAAFSYSSGIVITFKAHAASTTGPVTLNINGLGAKTIKKNVTADLALGDIMLNQYVSLIYDGTNFQLTSAVPSSSSGWSFGGNFVSTHTYLGTTSNFDLPFITNGIERMRIFSSGEVAIGNPPVATGAGFSVSGTGLWSSSIGINNTSGGQDWRIASDNDSYLKFVKVSGATITPMVINGINGNVGIGTSNPSGVLEVFDPVGYNGIVVSNNLSSAGSSVTFKTDDVNVRGEVGTNGSAHTTPNSLYITQYGAHPIKFATNSADRMLIDANGNVGIGTNTPTAKLQVYANSNAVTSASISGGASSLGAQRLSFSSGDVFDIGFQAAPNYAAWMQAGFNGTAEPILLNPLGGGVGIGNNAPTEALDITGNIKFSGALMPNNSAGTAGQVLTSSGGGVPTWTTPSAGLSGGTTNYVTKWTSPTTLSSSSLLFDNGTNVGIGTVTPNQKLNVNGNISLDDAAAIAAPSRVIGFPTASVGNHGNLTIQAKSTVFSGGANFGGSLVLAGGNFNASGATGPEWGGSILLRAGLNTFDGSGGGDIIVEAGGASNVERMRVKGNSGNVGIGTNAPTAKLHIGGTAGVDGIRFPDGTLQTTAAGPSVWSKSGSNVYPTTIADNIGIGTSTPSSKLHVFGANSSSAQFELSNTGSVTSFTTLTATQLDAAGLFFHTAAITGVGAKSSIIGGGKTSGNYPSILAFYTTATGGAQASERLTIIGNGNVGIGTSTPTNNLSFGNAADQKIAVENSGGTNVGRNLTIASGSAGGGFNNVAGGNMIIQAGVGTGTGESTISFQNGTTLGNSPTLQTMSTKMTILGNGNVGIGTTTPTAKLDVAGTLKVVDGTQGVGKILTSDASGNASWQDPPSKTSAFRAGAGSQAIVGFGYTIVDWNSVALNDGADFSIATDRYTAPVAGLYYFETGIYFPTYTGRCHTEFYVNGTTNHSSTFGNANGQYTNRTSLLIKLNAGDYVQVRVYNINAADNIGNGIAENWFSGYRIN